MDSTTSRKLDAMETLCVEYWVTLSRCDHGSAHTIAKMLDKYFESAPLEELPFYLKKRFELHDLLKSVVEVDAKDIIDEQFREDTFAPLKEMFDELDGNEKAGDMLEDLEKSKLLFVRYSKLREFLFSHHINSLSTENAIRTLGDEEYENFLNLLLRVIELCEITSKRYGSVMDNTLTKEQFVSIFEILGPESFANFNIELFNEFIRVFCWGLMFFHIMLGKPFYFRDDTILDGSDNDEVSSSFESVNESIQENQRPTAPPKRDNNPRATPKRDNNQRPTTPPKRDSNPRCRPTLKEVIRSRSPAKKSELMTKGDSALWNADDSNSDILSVSGSTGHRMKWTSQETQSLVDAVRQYGVGQWQFIRSDNKYKLSHKTNVQLKDRWRNLTKNDPSLLNMR